MDQNPPKEFRPPINLRIKFRSESVEQFIERYAVDVSRGGIFIRTREPLAVGTQLKLDFQFQNGTALMAGDGTVVWIREFDANRTSVPPGMGVRFDKLTPESQSVLEQLLIEKAKRERSGVPGSVGQGAGGIAVRRSSSTFATLEAQAAAAGRAGAPGAGLPASTAPSSAGPLAAVTSQSPALQPLSSSSPPSKTKTSDAASAGDPAAKSEAPAYRPLGKARNPFSSVAAAEPAPAPPPDSGASAAASENDSAAPFDDINDEPTQIAGRLPSFLLSDDDATVANAVSPRADQEKPPAAGATAAAGKGAKNKGNKGGDKARNETAGAAARTSLPGMARQESVAASPPSSLDSVAQGDKAGKAEPTTTESPTGEPAQASDRGGESKGSTPDDDKSAPMRPSKSRDAVALADGAAAAPSSAAQASGAGRPSEVTGTTAPGPAAAAARPAATASGRGGSARRRPGAVVVGVTVLVLGAAGIFLFRFFGSQSTDSGPGMASTAATVTPPTEAPLVPAAAEPAGSTQTAAAPGETGSMGSAGAAGEVQPAAAAPAPATNAPEGQGGPTVTQANAGADTRPEGSAEATPRKSAARSKVRRVASESGSATAATTPSGEGKAGDKAGDKTGDKTGDKSSASAGPAAGSAVPAAGPPTTAPAATAEQPTGGGETIHQIRVTSKPDGADVTLDGQAVGKTPFAVGISDLSTAHSVTVHKDGFEPFQQNIGASSSWSKPKPVKGKGTLQVLKIYARLKPMAGVQVRATGDAETTGTESAGKGQPSVPARSEGAAAPADARPAGESPP